MRLRPVKYSGRTTAEIVADAEMTYLKPYLIACPKECRCQRCWDDALSKLVEYSNTVLGGINA